MKNNGKNGKNGHDEWPTMLGVVDSPYVGRIESGDGEKSADEQARPAAMKEEEPPPIEVGRQRRRRGRLLVFCVVAMVLICVGLGLYVWYGGRTKVNYEIAERKKAGPVAEQSRAGAGGENTPTNQITSDAINQAKEELRKAGAVAEPSMTPEASGVALEGERQASSGAAFAPYIIPDTPILTGAKGVTAPGKVAEQAGSETAGGIGRSGSANGATGQTNYRGSAQASAYSIYAIPPERGSTPVPTRMPRVESRSAAPTLAPASVKLPPFGAMLPVRTLGAFYTFRNASLARLELTRDLLGDGWSLARGTVLIAQSQGSANDRAFLSLVGFIDPNTNRFIRLTGDVLGGDGGPGLKGKKRKIGGALGSVLNRVANGALALGQAALSRGGTTILMPGSSLPSYGSEFGLSQNAMSQREFVEVPANAPAYIMVTDLPKEVRGVDAEPIMQDGGGALTDDEMANLLSNGSPEQIKEALPRMPPDMRRIAELALSGR